MYRVHRTFTERLRYLGIFECRDCKEPLYVPRRYVYRFGENCRCPRCGTYRLSKLRAPDKIDPMDNGLFNLVEKMAGGRLYHCVFCRIQFYDRRSLASRDSSSRNESPAAEGVINPPPDTAMQGQ